METIFTQYFGLVLHAEKLTELFGIGITNSMVLGWIVSVCLIIAFTLLAKRVRVKGGGTSVSLFELIIEMVTSIMTDIMHDRKKAIKFSPLIITIFCFIMFNNWAGLLPGVGTISYHGEPLLRAWTSDLTGTLALAVTSIIILQIYTIRELNIGGYLKHFFSDKPWNPINIFVGVLEVLGEFTRIASLSLRLFGNIFAGEVLLVVLASITGLISPLATLPFVLMELFVGFIQAFVFTTLVIVYLTLALAHHESGEDLEDVSDHSVQYAHSTSDLSPVDAKRSGVV